MTIQEIFNVAIRLGTEADPRGRDQVEKNLARLKKEYEELSPKKKALFDTDSLTHPYADSRILFGDPNTPVTTILAGIDIEQEELLLADRLNQKGEHIDLVFGHHPKGVSLIGLADVMDLQIDLFTSYGVPITIAENLMNERIDEIKRRLSPTNHGRTIDAARLLKIPFMNVHTPTDNLVYQYLERSIVAKQPEYVKDVLDMLSDIPEYQEAQRGKAGPVLFSGSEKNHAGKVVAAQLTGGTEGSAKMYERLADSGVGTIISMHASEEHVKKVKENHINLVIAGHMSSDSLGINLFLDELEKKDIKIIPCSGLIRVSRVGKSK